MNAQEIIRLLRLAVLELQSHNEEYHHRTPQEFLDELRAAAAKLERDSVT